MPWLSLLKHWKLIVGGLGIIALVIAVTMHFRYVSGLEDKVAVLTADKAALEVAVEGQKDTIRLQNDAILDWSLYMGEVEETMQEMADNQAEANEQSRILNDVLGKHDLEALSLAKPGLIERRINGGTNDVFRMLNDETAGDLHDPG